MNRHSFKDWMIAVRPWSFPASAMPVIVTMGYLYACGHEPDWGLGIWALVNIILFHASGNTWSDYFDYKHRVDADDTFGAKTLTDGMFTPKEIFNLSLALLAAALAGGIGLLLLTDLRLLYIALGGVACTLLYPPLKFNALGDVVIFMAYALLPILGTTLVATGAFHPEALWLSVPVGLITVSILHANNTRDTLTDTRAGIRTLAMTIGTRASVLLYGFEVLFPFVWVAVCAVWGLLPIGSLAALLAIPVAIGNTRRMLRFHKPETFALIANVDELSAKLQLLFSLLLTLGMALTR